MDYLKLPGLKFERFVAGMSQQELADRSRVHRNTIQRLETGTTGTRAATVKRLAEALGIDSRKLLEGEPPPTWPD